MTRASGSSSDSPPARRSGETTRRDGESPHRLLIFLVGVSLVAHLVVLHRVSERYRSGAVSYIELDLEETSRSFARVIPRPRPRNEIPVVPEARPVTVPERPIPKLQIEPAPARPESVTGVDAAVISRPDIPSSPAVTGFAAGDWAAPPAGPSSHFGKRDYMDMIRMRIESRKKYPRAARSRQIEGRVKLRFTLLPDGRVRESEILESSGHAILDQAALEAVTAAAPFPPSPPNLFTGSLPLEITLIFELT